MTRGTDWTLEHYSFCIDSLIDGHTAEKIASVMTRIFRRKFTRGSVIGRMNRDFGGGSQIEKIDGGENVVIN